MNSFVSAAGGSSTPDWIPIIVGLIATVLSGGGVAALIKSRPEGSKILVDAAADVVIVQTGVITDLRNELAQAKKEIQELRTLLSEVTTLRAENEHLKVRVSFLEAEEQRLRARVLELEQNAKP